MSDQATDRPPTPDESMGMEWWNHLSEADRAAWCKRAETAVPAEAWAAFKRGFAATLPASLSKSDLESMLQADIPNDRCRFRLEENRVGSWRIITYGYAPSQYTKEQVELRRLIGTHFTYEVRDAES